MQMNTAQAIELFGDDGIDSVAVELADGADAAAVQTRSRPRSPAACRRPRSSTTPRCWRETTKDFTQEINVVGNILLGFGFVALFVSIFIIYNTFSIVLGQRTRELALLRTIGADPAQIRRSVIGEALFMGVLASAAGIGGGIAIAKGIDALFGLMGVDLSRLAADPRAADADRRRRDRNRRHPRGGAGAGTPGRHRAADRRPVGARAGASFPQARRHRVSRSSSAVWLPPSPARLARFGAAGHRARCDGAVRRRHRAQPARRRSVTRCSAGRCGPAGVAGRLAQRNAARNSRRTATTAAALMIGLTLVTTALVVGDSVKASMGSTFERSAKADYYVTDELDDVGFPASLAGELAQSDAVAAATGFTPASTPVSTARSPASSASTSIRSTTCSTSASRKAASSPTPSTRPSSRSTRRRPPAPSWATPSPSSRRPGPASTPRSSGVFDDQAILGEDYLFDTRVLDAVGIDADAEWLAVLVRRRRLAGDARTRSSPGSPTSTRYAAIETADQFRDRVDGMVDKILAMVNAMVALAVVIALIGIGNTLALSVFERTRELGLVRAVGMTRRQVRRMVRFEAALVALFGATLGVGLGLLFGYGVVSALPASFATVLGAGARSSSWCSSPPAPAWSRPCSPPAAPAVSTCSTPSPTELRRPECTTALRPPLPFLPNRHPSSRSACRLVEGLADERSATWSGSRRGVARERNDTSPPTITSCPGVGQKLGTFISSENAADLAALRDLIEAGKV